MNQTKKDVIKLSNILNSTRYSISQSTLFKKSISNKNINKQNKIDKENFDVIYQDQDYQSLLKQNLELTSKLKEQDFLMNLYKKQNKDLKKLKKNFKFENLQLIQNNYQLKQKNLLLNRKIKEFENYIQSKDKEIQKTIAEKQEYKKLIKELMQQAEIHDIKNFQKFQNMKNQHEIQAYEEQQKTTIEYIKQISTKLEQINFEQLKYEEINEQYVFSIFDIVLFVRQKVNTIQKVLQAQKTSLHKKNYNINKEQINQDLNNNIAKFAFA